MNNNTPNIFQLSKNNLFDDDYEDKINSLLESKVDINSKDENGNTILTLICYHSFYLSLSPYGDVDEKVMIFIKVVKFLIEETKIDINIQNNLGQTALHGACKALIYCFAGRAVKLLCEAKANVNIKDNDGITPLMSLCDREYNPHIENGIKYLIEHKANINEKDKDSNNCLVLCYKNSLYNYYNICIAKYILSKKDFVLTNEDLKKIEKIHKDSEYHFHECKIINECKKKLKMK